MMTERRCTYPTYIKKEQKWHKNTQHFISSSSSSFSVCNRKLVLQINYGDNDCFVFQTGTIRITQTGDILVVRERAHCTEHHLMMEQNIQYIFPPGRRTRIWWAISDTSTYDIHTQPRDGLGDAVKPSHNAHKHISFITLYIFILNKNLLRNKFI